MPRYAASGLGLHCLPVCMYHKNDARHVWVYLRAMFSDNVGSQIADSWNQIEIILYDSL